MIWGLGQVHQNVVFGQVETLSLQQLGFEHPGYHEHRSGQRTPRGLLLLRQWCDLGHKTNVLA